MELVSSGHVWCVAALLFSSTKAQKVKYAANAGAPFFVKNLVAILYIRF